MDRMTLDLALTEAVELLRRIRVSKTDKLFVSMCEDIIANGFSTEGQEE